MALLRDFKKKSGLFPWSNLLQGSGDSLHTLVASNTIGAPEPLQSAAAPVPIAVSLGVATASEPSAQESALRTWPAIARPKRAGLGIGERKMVQMLCDSMVVLAGGAIILGLSGRTVGPDAVLLSASILFALWFFFADAFDAYKTPVIQSVFGSSYAAAKVLLLTVGAYTLVAWLTGGSFPVIRLRISETIEALLLVAPLLAERTFISRLLTRAPMRRRVVVVGANVDGFEMGDALANYDGKSYDFLGYFDDEARSPGSIDSHGPHSAVRSRDGLAQLVWPVSELLPIHQSVGIDQVVLANPNQTVNLLTALSLLHERGVQITPMFALYQDLTGRVPVSHLGDDWYVALPAHVKTNRSYLIVKRSLDMAMALAALAISALLIPLLAVAIKLDSPGPVFFKQLRVGRGGRLFRIVKFRTMRRDAEALTGAVWASDSDPRITRVGNFLRKSRLDEIPQLWNVLVGDMSFVGPRPERPEFDDELEREIPFYRARRAVRPGLTGWAQVSHGYGNSLLDALRKVEYDLYYIKNESLYLDVLILLRTVAVVLKLGGT